MKICNKCKNNLDFNCFGKCSRRKDGLHLSCINCKKKYDKEYRLNNKENISNKQKAYNERNKEKISTQYKKWFQDNKKRIIELRKNRRHSNSLIKFKHNIRSLISTSFYRRNNIIKSKKTEEILGCSLDFFFEYIQSLFTEGMTVEKLGVEIHIDHIIPLATAKTEEDIIKLSHYTNMQPLWAEDNRKKGSKIFNST